LRSLNARRVGLLAGALGLSGLAALSCTLHFPEDAVYTCTTDSDCEGDGYKCLAIPGRTAFCCKPEPEICDGKDNDCDGVIDNIEPWDCYDGPAGTEGVGLCHAGKQACNNGVPGPCLEEQLPASEEICNGYDDNCDGRTDEGFDLTSDLKHCGSCTNACRGDEVCAKGACTVITEICNDGLDNDGNSLTDCADPACAGQRCRPDPSTFTCDSNNACTCNGVADPPPETNCGNHSDDDCDGLIDCADPDCEGKDCDPLADPDAGVASRCLCQGLSAHELDCGNHHDDDSDGKTDCDDPDCDGKECNDIQKGCTCAMVAGDGGLVRGKTETNCADGIDNDGDGLRDCLDPDCDGKACKKKTDAGLADGTCHDKDCK
jgi:hypothetical protein